MGNLNGARPKLSPTSARRRINPEEDGSFEATFPELAMLEKNLINQGFAWEKEFITVRNLSLRTVTLIPSGEIKAAIVLCHGYGDHFSWNLRKHFLFLADQGYLVTGIELEGHGQSDTKLGLLYSVSDIVSDLHTFVKLQKEKFKQVNSWFLMGESMGGMCAILESIQAAKDNVKFNGMVLVAPMCKIADEMKPNPMAVNFLLALAKMFPSLSVTPSDFDDKYIFKDKEFLAKASKDPLRYFGKPRLATGAALYLSTVYLENHFNDVTIPFLVIHGKKDVVTTYQASVELFEKSSKVLDSDKKIILPEDGWHGLLFAEPEESMVGFWAEIFAFLESKC